MNVFWVLIGGLVLLYLVVRELWAWRCDRRWRRLSMDWEAQAELRALGRAAAEQRKKDAA